MSQVYATYFLCSGFNNLVLVFLETCRGLILFKTFKGQN